MRLFNQFTSFNQATCISSIACFISIILSIQTIQAQTFTSPVLNPFGLVSSTTTTSGQTANVVLEDLDGDGDLDALTGNLDNKNGIFVGEYDYYENIGTASNPQFAMPVIDPFGLTPLIGPRPTIGDLDGDGDLDLMVGEEMDNLYYLENTGTSTSPQFAAPIANPFGIHLITMGNLWTPEFVDLDNDSDLDLLVVSFTGVFRYFENSGTVTNPQFTAYQSTPFGLNNIQVADPAYSDFADLDGDGDLDMLVGGFFGINEKFKFYENTGTASNPQFAAPVAHPFGLIDINVSYPAFADLDNDGDTDLMAGAMQGDFQYFENTSITVSTKEVDDLNKIQFYPNPTNGLLFIDSQRSISKLFVLNSLGQLIHTIQPKEKLVDISSLASGSYLIQVIDHKGQSTTKYVIKH